jgi:phosphoserine phosphatase
MKTVVFDFDKTLTNYDTMAALVFFEIKKKKYKILYLLFYALLRALSKIGFISVKEEKELAIKYVLTSDYRTFELLCSSFIKTIEFNDIVYILNAEKARGNRVIVISASPEAYLCKMFPEIEVIGTNFHINGNKIVSINQHPYGQKKKDILIKKGIVNIDMLYYDSKSDEYMIPLCKSWVQIKNGKMIKHSQK